MKDNWVAVTKRMPEKDDYPILYYLPELQGGPMIYPKLKNIKIPINSGGFWQSIVMPTGEGEP